MSFHPRGVFVPLVTPFTDTGEVAFGDLERLARTVLDDGAAGIVALGTTAEAATLTPRERAEIVRVCGDVCAPRGAALIVGAGSNDTVGSERELADLSAGADLAAALVVAPYYTRPSEAGVEAHFEYLAERSPVPLVVYNVPYRTGEYVGWRTLTRLSQHPRIVGVKQAVGAVDADTARLVAAASDDFSVLAGEDALVSPLYAMGAHGAILATANVCTREHVELFDAWQRSDIAGARVLANSLVEPACALMSRPNPTMIKAVLHKQGRIGSAAVRLPLVAVDDPSDVLGVLDLPHAAAMPRSQR